MCKMEEEIPISHKEELLIYRKICLGFSSQMGLAHCLMGLEGGCKFTPNIEAGGLRALKSGSRFRFSEFIDVNKGI